MLRTRISALIPLIRLSDKYDMKTVYDEALVRLKRYYTMDLQQWRNNPRRATFVSATMEDAIPIINLAYAINEPDLLTLSCLICTAFDEKILWEATRQPSGLQLDDLARILSGKAALARKCNELDVAFMHWTMTEWRCSVSKPYKHDTCKHSMTKFMGKPFFGAFVRALAEESKTLAPQAEGATAKTIWPWSSQNPDVCDNDRQKLKIKVDKICTELWDALPAIFDVPKESNGTSDDRNGESGSSSGDENESDSSESSDED